MREIVEFEPVKLRSVMKWGIKIKDSSAVKGVIVPAIERKIFVPVKFLEVPHMYNIKKMIEKNPEDIWNRYSGDLWIKVLDWEIQYQERRVNAFIKEAMNFKFNTMAEMFREYSNSIFLPTIG